MSAFYPLGTEAAASVRWPRSEIHLRKDGDLDASTSVILIDVGARSGGVGHPNVGVATGCRHFDNLSGEDRLKYGNTFSDRLDLNAGMAEKDERSL